MKKILIILCVIATVFSFTQSVFAQNSKNNASSDSALIDADNIPYERTPLNKLGRGLINTLTCLLEVPAEAFKVAEEKDPLVGCTLGVAEGFVTAFLRGLSGLYDTLTCVIPPYNKPLMQPEYAWESAVNKFTAHPNEPADSL